MNTQYTVCQLVKYIISKGFHPACSLFKFFIWDININLKLDFSVWKNCMKLDKFFL